MEQKKKIERRDVKKWEDFTYAEMIAVRGFYKLWFDAMVERICIKCCKPIGDDNEEESVTGLCPACEAKMSDADKEAARKFYVACDPEGKQGFPEMVYIISERGARDGKNLGWELLNKSWRYRDAFFNALKNTIVEKINTSFEIKR